MYIYIYIYCLYTCIHIQTYIYVYMHTYIHVCIYIYIRVYVCVTVCCDGSSLLLYYLLPGLYSTRRFEHRVEGAGGEKCYIWVALLVLGYLSNTASFAFYDITCLTRLSDFATFPL